MNCLKNTKNFFLPQSIFIYCVALNFVVIIFFLSNAKTCKSPRMYEMQKVCPFTPPSVQNEHGGWYYSKKLISTQHVAFDKIFGQALVNYLGKTKIYDIGAGVGQFKVFSTNSEVTVISFDGGNNIESLENTQVPIRNDPNFIIPKVCWIDASIPVNKLEPLDWVLSLEVGEHIPKSGESIFLDNLVKLSKIGVILSWAVKGQGGYHHVNTQNNDYIIKEMVKRGLKYDFHQSQLFRSSVSELKWLKNTIMVFKK